MVFLRISKLLIHISGTAIFTFLNTPLSAVVSGLKSYAFGKWSTILNATLILALPPVAVMYPVTRKYASE